MTIYLDHAATTPVDPRVVEAMLPIFTGQFGNPSSIYSLGQDAARAIDAARDQVAAVLNARNGDIIFTGGGTDSDNIAIRGAAYAQKKTRQSHHHLRQRAPRSYSHLRVAGAQRGILRHVPEVGQ